MPQVKPKYYQPIHDKVNSAKSGSMAMQRIKDSILSELNSGRYNEEFVEQLLRDLGWKTEKKTNVPILKFEGKMLEELVAEVLAGAENTLKATPKNIVGTSAAKKATTPSTTTTSSVSGKKVPPPPPPLPGTKSSQVTQTLSQRKERLSAQSGVKPPNVNQDPSSQPSEPPKQTTIQTEPKISSTVNVNVDDPNPFAAFDGLEEITLNVTPIPEPPSKASEEVTTLSVNFHVSTENPPSKRVETPRAPLSNPSPLATPPVPEKRYPPAPPEKPNKPKSIPAPTHEATFLAAAGDLDLKRLEIYQRAEAERRKQQLLKSKENEISSFARNYEARMTEIKPLNFKLNKAEIGLINDYTSKFRDLEYKRIKLAEFVPLVEEDLKQINKKSPLWGIMNDMCNQGKALLTAPVATSEIVMPLKKPLKGRNDPPVVPTPRISTSTTSSVSVPPSVLTTTNSPPYLPMAQHTATSATPTKIQTLPPRSEEQRQILNCIAPITMSILNYNQSRKKSRFGKSNKRKKQIEAIQSALNTLSLHLHISDPSKEIKTDIVYTNAIKKIQEVHDEIKKEKRYSGEASSTLQDIAQRFLTEVEGGAFKAPEKKHSKPKK